MRTIAQKQNQPQKPVSPNAAWPQAELTRYLRRTIEDQAAQRTLQTQPEGSKRAIPGAAFPRRHNDFSQIPVHLPAAASIPVNLAINPPGDKYEQEADRMAEQVMGTPEPQFQRHRPGDEGRRESHAGQPDRLPGRVQAERVHGSGTGQIPAPPTVQQVLRSPGQALDSEDR